MSDVGQQRRIFECLSLQLRYSTCDKVAPDIELSDVEQTTSNLPMIVDPFF